MTELITKRTMDWVEDTLKADPTKKTFAYVAHQAIHGPIQVPLGVVPLGANDVLKVPPHYMDGPCRKIMPADHPTRLMVCGMMQAVDQSLKNITEK